ncbi:MAG: TnpV protein [Eubacterium sp.]|nr:TnpV protein [Eubacterium sp.]
MLYYNLLTSGKLNSYLADIEGQAEKLFSRLITELTKKEDVTEALKAENQMEWVRRMNSIRSGVAEIIYTDLIDI